MTVLIGSDRNLRPFDGRCRAAQASAWPGAARAVSSAGISAQRKTVLCVRPVDRRGAAERMNHAGSAAPPRVAARWC